MYEILKLNEISPVANKYFGDKYALGSDFANPDAILLRSFAMHDYKPGTNLKCVARCGAGVNNIPVADYTKGGIVVFNTPGANANAVKELVICAMLLASRKIVPAMDWTKTLKGKGDEVGKLVEKGKNAYVGPEITGKKLGVIGLGAIGNLVANAAVGLGMTVYGYDPFISVDAAWNLSNNVIHETDLSHLYSECDYITLHVPMLPATKGMLDGEAFSKMKTDVRIINCSRGELVNNAELLTAIKSGKVGCYVTDFPSDDLINADKVICIPHLGASTPEAEDNCAVMAAKQVVNFLENGNIVNSVNFPDCVVNRSGKCRLCIVHQNVSSMLKQFTDVVSAARINIANLLSQAKGEFAYAIIDLDADCDETLVKKIGAVEGVINVRVIR
ncbi:MAG: phosphoglycerate dehydrogenase [Firmicutes bacterium]|nr:phosphoglycerate dehydrogenase [Bacillota bacterium]